VKVSKRLIKYSWFSIFERKYSTYIHYIFNFFFQTNTMQAIIVTDEVRTYAIFIYEWMGWTTHTEAGGDTTEGQGGN
jgi:hypothetical protein